MFSLRYLPGVHLPALRVPQDAHRDAEAGGADPGPLHTVHPHLTRQARVSNIFNGKYLKIFYGKYLKIFKYFMENILWKIFEQYFMENI